MLDIFHVINGQIQFRIPTTMAIKEFADVYRRRRIVEGDFNGAKKIMNTKEMVYVVDMSNFILKNNLHAGFLPKEKSRRIMSDIELPLDWKPDVIIKAAIKKYIEIQQIYVPSAVILCSLQNAQRVTAEVVDTYIESLQMNLRKHNEMLSQTHLTPEERLEAREIKTELHADLKAIIELTTKLPRSIKDMKILEENVTKEAQDLANAKASGSKIGRYELPENNQIKS